MTQPPAPPTDWLNYHHLLYFWTVVREGGVQRAADRLRLSQPTISAQIRRLEDTLGAKLFDKRGRTLSLTETGRIVYRYADDIFPVGRELVETLKGRPAGHAGRLTIGVANAVPKLIIHRLLTPVFAMTPAPFVSCLEDNTDSLMTRLATYELDLAITDRPAPPHVKVRVYNHLLGASSTTMFATAKTAAKLRRGFPRSLDGASMLMPARGTAVRQSLDDWLDRSGIHPRPIADFEDSALMKAFGRETAAVFPAPTVIADDVCALYGVRPIGTVPGVREEYYVLSVERRLSHPAVLTMTNTARHKMFDI